MRVEIVKFQILEIVYRDFEDLTCNILNVEYRFRLR